MAASDIDNRRHAALQLLRPACIALMKDTTVQNVKLLITALGAVDPEVTQEIQQYILFPVQNALHLKVLPDSLLCELCEAVAAVFNKSEVMMTQMFFDVLNPLIYSVISPDGANKVSTRSEDIRISLVKAITVLLKACPEKVLNDVYSLQCLPVLGQLVSLLLQLAEYERSRALQVSALECLHVLLQTGTKYGKTNAVLLGDLFAFCLPGVTMTTCRIITGDSKQGQAVIGKAMSVWCRIVTLVMSDGLLKQSQSQRQQSLVKSKALKDSALEKLESLKVKRNDEWIQATAAKLDVLIGQIGKLVSNSNWRVRLSLAELAEEVLTSCSKSLSKSVPKLLECLVALIGDDYGNVAKKSLAALQVFSQTQTGTPEEQTLLGILEENMYNLTTSLPRQIKMCDEEDKPALINLLNGYIKLLGPKIQCVINSTPHLNRLCLALVQALELDISDIKIVEERNTLLHNDSEVFAENDAAEQTWKPRKYFRHFRDETILSGLMLVCRQLGEHGNLYILVDHMLDIYQESSMYKLAAVLMINEMVVGAAASAQEKEDKKILHDVISMLMDEYLSLSNLKLVDSLSDNIVTPKQSPPSSSPWASALAVVKPDESWEAKKNLANRNRAILLMTLFIEGLGKFAKALGKDFQNHLMTALYPLVENLGHENVHISSTAWAALVEVTAACGYKSLDNLIRDNSDYLVSSVSLRLRHFDQNRRAPRTTCVMLRHCSQELLPLIDHSITELLDSLDENYTEDLVLFMPVLLELATAIGRWFPPTKQKQEKKTTSEEPASALASLDPADVDAYIREITKALKIASSDFTDEGVNAASGQDENAKERTLADIEADMKKLMEEKKEQEKQAEEDDDDVDEERKKETPKHIQVVKEVLQRIKNLLSSHDARLRVQALDVVCQSCENLRDHERELLPQIHQIWSGFWPLFRSEEKFIVIKAMQTLLVMSEVSGDFIKLRVKRQVMPGLKSYMEKQGKISSGSRSAYLHTSHFKLQLCMLSTLGALAKNLSLDSEDLDTVASMCLPYLSDLQPSALQMACIEAFSSFISLDPDAMWLLLCGTFCPIDLTPPGKLFRPVHFPNGPGKTNSFSSNITELFKMHYS